MIGYSKISETRRYRRRKRGDAREDENRRKRERGREVGKAGGGGAERESTGGRVVADRTRGWGLTTTTPQRRGFLFVPASSFLFLSPLPDPTHPPSESFDSSARLCHPLALSHPPPLPFPPLPLRTTVHLKYEFDITFHPTALARPPPRTSSSVSSLPAPTPRAPPLPRARHGRPTITGPRTI